MRRPSATAVRRARRDRLRPERNVDDEHRQLLDAALSRDADKSAAMLAAHYRKTAQFIEHIISTQDRQALHA